jgi:RNA-binding protein
MKLAHIIKVKVFSNESDDEKIILERLLELFPFDIKQEKISLKRSTAIGFEEKKIIIFEIVISKERHTRKFIERLEKNLGDNQKKIILDQVRSRLDENLDFYLRFDKHEYTKNHKLVITESGDCFHMRISIAAFPKKREIAIKLINTIFS